MKFKTRIAAVLNSLLQGETLSIMDGFHRFGVTNLSRELSRSIEQPMGIILTRTKIVHNPKHGHAVWYYQYHLTKCRQTKEALNKAWKYVDENLIASTQKKNKGNGYQQQSIF